MFRINCDDGARHSVENIEMAKSLDSISFCFKNYRKGMALTKYSIGALCDSVDNIDKYKTGNESR